MRASRAVAGRRGSFPLSRPVRRCADYTVRERCTGSGGTRTGPNRLERPGSLLAVRTGRRLRCFLVEVRSEEVAVDRVREVPVEKKKLQVAKPRHYPEENGESREQVAQPRRRP